jgi:hypothetical protein
VPRRGVVHRPCTGRGRGAGAARRRISCTQAQRHVTVAVHELLEVVGGQVDEHGAPGEGLRYGAGRTTAGETVQNYAGFSGSGGSKIGPALSTCPRRGKWLPQSGQVAILILPRFDMLSWAFLDRTRKFSGRLSSLIPLM